MNINEELVRRITEAVVKQIQSPKEGQSGRPAVTGGERINAVIIKNISAAYRTFFQYI